MRSKLIFLFIITDAVFAQQDIEISYSKLYTTPFTHASLYSPQIRSSYSIKLLTTIEVHEKIYFQIGINYSYRSIIWGDNIFETLVDYNYRKEYPNPYIFEKVQWSEDYTSLQLPLICHYQYPVNQYSFILVGGGFQCGYLFNRSSQTTSISGKNEKWDNGGTIVGGMILDAQLKIQATKYCGFALRSEYLYDLYPKEGKRDLEFQSFGFGAGIFINIH